MTTPPTDLPQQAPVQTPAVARSRHVVIGCRIVRWMGTLLLLYLGGPVFWLARGIQEEASAQVWQAERRWTHVHGSAFLSLLWYAPLLLFHALLAAFWASIFAFLARLLHVPFLALLGDATLFPPTPLNLLLRWVLALPLASLCATVLELLHPRTIWESRRVLTPEEQQQLARIQTRTPTTPKPARTRRSTPAITVVEERPARSPTQQSTGASTCVQQQSAGKCAPREVQERPDAAQTPAPRTCQPGATSTHLLALPTTIERRLPAPPRVRFTWDEGDGIIDDSDTGETR